MASLARRIIAWQRVHGRHDLPWQSADAYKVWLSEIMLQQTQVATVIPYYLRFIEAFPTITSLASATEEDVLRHWSGLGYYARGRNLHRAAQIIVAQYAGEFPDEFEQIIALPGIGRSTAAAICALAFHQNHAILDGNVKRVLARFCGVEGWTGNKEVEKRLWQKAEAFLPKGGVAIYTQALMDMGATICTRSKPKCSDCPLQKDCVALKTDRVAILPTPRPRKALPEKHTTFLLLTHGRDILLEKHSSQGIWGGLWCLPQLDEGVFGDYLQLNDMKLKDGIELPTFTHTFTHFKLHISPILLRLANKPLKVQQSSGIWLGIDEALQAAIPTPVRKVLKELSAGSY